MRKKIILLIGFLLIIFSNGSNIFGENYCFLEINNNTSKYWRIDVDNICVGAISPFLSQQIKIQRPVKKFKVELNGISSDRGHMQRKFFWPEDELGGKFFWRVEE